MFGGNSPEHDVSLHSAESVLANLDRSKYEIVPLAITRDGIWRTGIEPAELHDAPPTPEAAKIEPLSYFAGTTKDARPCDVIFPVLHGPNGEDGTVQGLLELADIPYVGCGVLGSALAMDKEKAKMLLQAAGIPVVDYLVVKKNRWDQEPEAVLSEAAQRIGYPCIVKPANMGSSIGVSKAANREELVARIAEAIAYDSKVVIERFINNRELSCAVLGNDEPAASLVGELVFVANEVLNYEDKYTRPSFHFNAPAAISESMTQQIREQSLLAYRTLELSGLSRVDFFLDRDTDRVFLNEVNTLPGFTHDSIYPKMWDASGLPYPQLLDRLIELALERYQDRERRRTAFTASHEG